MYIQDVVRYDQLDDELLDFYRAISVDMIHLELRSGVSGAESALAGDLQAGRDCTDRFAAARERIEAHGLRLNAAFMSAWPAITLGTEQADEQIGAWSRMLESLGRAGIPHLGWNFKPMGNFRTTAAIGRGGARYSTFDLEEHHAQLPPQHQPPVDEATMWANMERFLAAVIPVAERAGVRMALHPDDPPVPEPLGGVAQICSTLDQFRRTLFTLAPSAANAMLFCQGCMTELLGADGIYDAIAELAGSGKVAWVHFRNVAGRLPRFREVFIDEGDVDMRRAMQTWRDNGFGGPYMMDHTPHFAGRHDDLRGKAYAVGYIRALIQQVYAG